MKKGGLVLGVLLVLVAGSVASAAMVQEFTYSGAAAGTSSGDVLYSQLDDPTGSAYSDQLFEAPYAAYSSGGADDFVVTASTSWELDSLFTAGSMTVGGANPFFVNVAFYADAGGFLGAVISDSCFFPANTNVTADGGDLTMDVSGCSIPAQTVWFTQQVRMDFNPLGQHYWATQFPQYNGEGLWRNPGGGFGDDCLDWGPMNTVCGLTGKGWMFELSGTEVAGQDGVPAIGPFGAVLLVLALGGGSAYVLRRRRG